jgi:hypothetical protein
MLHKNTKQKEIDNETFPFTESHIKKFKEELEEAGGFEELMIKKLAMKKEKGSTIVEYYDDIESYKKTFLTGIYESLQPYYDVEIPYSFWSLLYEVLQKREDETE